MNVCRVCGEEKSPLDFNVELNDQTISNWSYRELIEHHTRVSLKTNKLLPQSICEECRAQVDGFANFSHRLEIVQATFDTVEDEFETSVTTECFKASIENPVVNECVGWDVPIKKRSRLNDTQEEERTVESLFRNEFSGLSSMTFQLDVQDIDKLESGELLESAQILLNLTRWSDLVKSCELCKAPVCNILALNKHLESHHNPREIQISCLICTRKFKTTLGLLNHIDKHTEQEHLTHCCLICNKIFIDLDLLHQHQKACHSTEVDEIFQCFICGQFSESLLSLEKHCRTVHDDNSERVDSTPTEIEEAVRRPKRTKYEVKSEELSSSESEDVNDFFDESSSEDDKKPPRSRRRKETKHAITRKRTNNAQKSQQRNTHYGADIDTFEKLYADELNGKSKFPISLHLNISESCQLPNGEIPEEFASKISKIRWRDLLSCGFCQTSFSNINELFEHADTNHNPRSKIFNCQSCKGEFSAYCESPLINHVIERHFHEHLKFCCLVCSKMFFDLSSLINHNKSHEGRFELLVCLICGWYAKTLDDLKEHKAYHISIEKSENQLLCEKVFDKFNSGAETLIRNHCVADYEKNPDGSVKEEYQERFVVDWSFGQYQCEPCKATFPNPFELFVHQRLKHPKDVFKKNYTCSLCFDKKDYSNLFTFVNHATSKHLESGKFTCIVCSKVFWNYLGLAHHYKNVHPTFPCVFCCHCGKIFMNVTVASSHFKTLNLLRTPEERKLLKEGKIQEEMSHICHVCARSFKSRGTLLNHVKTHETLEPSDLLQCHICSKFYKNKYKLAQHMVCHEDLRSWKCKVCGQAFNYKKLLQRHIQAVHENERPFGCTFCDKRFNSKYDLTVHVRLHTGDFPYECPVTDCDAKYPAWSNLFKHCQSRHKLDIRSEGYKKLKATQKKNADEFGSD